MAIGSLYGPWLSAARERGVDVDPVLRGLGVTEAQLVAPEMRLSPDADDWFGRELFRRTRRPGLGIAAASRVRVRDLELLGYLIACADDLGQALLMMQRYARLAGDSLACSLRHDGGHAVLALNRSAGRTFPEEMSDFTAGVALHLVRQLSSQVAQPLEVRLPRSRPGDTRPFRDFFAAPICFGAASCELIFRSASLTAPLASADPVLARILRDHAEASLARLLPDAAVGERARAAVAREGARGVWSASAVARQLGMSSRTLRRRLREDGTSLRALVDDVRRERALSFAEAGRHSASEIAARLGFADTTSLARAFRRWTGASPREFLRKAGRAT